MRNKIIISLIFMLVMIMCSITVYANEQKVPKVIINNELLALDKPPVIDEGTTLVPLRKILEKFNFQVDWIDAGTYQSINIFNGEKNVMLFMNSVLASSIATSEPTEEFYVKYHRLEKGPRLIGDTSYVPLRFISEIFGFNVNWNGEDYIIEIDGKILPKITTKESLKKWVSDNEYETFKNKYLTELTESSKNLLAFAMASNIIGQDVRLNKPELNKYDTVITDENGNKVTLKNLSKLKLLDVAFSKNDWQNKENKYNSKKDVIIMHYTVMTENNGKVTISITNNDYKFVNLTLLLFKDDIYQSYNWPADIWRQIENENVIRNMNATQVTLSLGKPKEILTTIENGKSFEVWVYDKKKVYFQDGKVAIIK